jgi:excisionase family DNA binding protein
MLGISKTTASDRRPESLLSVPEFAAVLGVTPSCIRAWVHKRRVRYHKIGRLVRLPQSELDRLLTESAVPARSAAR